MKPRAVQGFQDLWVDRDGNVYEGLEGSLELLPVSRTSRYNRVSALVCGRRERIHVHVLMAVAFLGLDRAQLGRSASSIQVDHKDNNKRNNRLDNLELVTKNENLRRAWDSGRYRRNGYASKGRPKKSLRKFSEEQVKSMAELRSQGLSYREIGNRMDCDHKVVYRILKGETYQSWI